MREGKFLFAYLDVISFVTRPERVGAVYFYSLSSGSESMVGRLGGNRARVRPQLCDVLERTAQADNPDARVRRRSEDSDLVPG